MAGNGKQGKIAYALSWTKAFKYPIELEKYTKLNKKVQSVTETEPW